MATSWKKETRVYMWANYYSVDDTWKAWDEDITYKTGKRVYDIYLNKMIDEERTKHEWFLENLKTGERFNGFKTLKSAKEFAESRG